MRFWDSSALVPLFIRESGTEDVARLANEDSGVAAWWGARVECIATFARLRRQGLLQAGDEMTAVRDLLVFAAAWQEIEPVEQIRQGAADVVGMHPLRAADAFQLSAARLWSGGRPAGHEFVCLDNRLREAALRDGFRVLPER